jgi:hypothetical protein
MRLLARHLPAVLAFPVGILVLTFAVILLVCVVESPLHISLLLAVAGVPAILYARLVVTPLWRRAQPRLDKPGLGTLP